MLAYAKKHEDAKEDLTICREITGVLSSVKPSDEPSDKQKKYIKAIKALCASGLRRLYVLTQISPEIKTLCNTEYKAEYKDEVEKFNRGLTVKFNRYLAVHDQYDEITPKITVLSIDKKIEVTPFKQFMGYYLTLRYHEFVKANDSASAEEILNEACKYGSYRALDTRMELNLIKLRSLTKENVSEADALLEKIQIDAAQIGNIYRAIGYGRAATSLLSAANVYFKIFDAKGIKIARERFEALESEKKITGKDRTEKLKKVEKTHALQEIDKLLERTVEYFYLSYFSSETRLSIALNHAINGAAELLTHFESVDDGEEFVTQILPRSFDITNPRLLFNTANNYVEQERKSHPEEFPSPTKVM